MIDTGRWDDSWYSNLDPDFKHAWDYINDNCDNAGVWDPNFRIANARIGGSRVGYEIDWEAFRKLAGYRIDVLENGKWWSVNHIAFQCRRALSMRGKNGPNYPHIFIFNLLRQHGLVERYAEVEVKRFGKSILLKVDPASPESKTGKLQPRPVPGATQADLQLDADSPSRRRVLANGILEHLNHVCRRRFSHSSHNIKLIESCLKETSDDADGLKKMISRQAQRWLGTDFEEYLQPTTLFRKRKWREEYDKRDLPVQKSENNAQQNRDHGKF